MSSHISSSNNFFTDQKDEVLVVSGAAAVARGAYEAGAGLIMTYPGSPVVETYELLASDNSPVKDICQIVINEHVALHRGLGFSLTGGRSLVIMKHVGFNVASDPAHYSAYMGVNGGMVIYTGFDPGSNCSTGEFDVRFYSLHTHLPLLEPGNFQEAADFTKIAFELSEKIKLPVILLMPSSMCYGVGTIETEKTTEIRKNLRFINSEEYTNVGVRAVARHKNLLGKINNFYNLTDEFDLKNKYISEDNDHLIITSGIYYDYIVEFLMENNLLHSFDIYSPSFTYPLNSEEIYRILIKYKEISFIEDLEGFLENQILGIIARNGLSLKINSRDFESRCGSMGSREIEKILNQFLLHKSDESIDYDLNPVFREGTFCSGCPHRAFFHVLKKVLKENDVIGGDIGCSSLPPHFSSWLTCMNSGTSIATGVVLANRDTDQKTVSLIGDSTYFHSGIQTILDSAQIDSDHLCIVLDNDWTAMTGHQKTPSTSKGTRGEIYENSVNIKDLLVASGVRKIYEIDPYHLIRFEKLLRKMINDKGFSVLIIKRECALQEKRRDEKKKRKNRYVIVEERCRECNLCYSVLTCPAIIKNEDEKLYIEEDDCHHCSVCYQICPNSAIISIQETDNND